MKELSIEEKAKAYDYAVNKAKELILNENGVVRVDKPLFDELFPSEMEESEDEKIRKGLIDFVNQYGDNFYGQISKEYAIAWLEKQGEKKHQYKSRPRYVEEAELLGAKKQELLKKENALKNSPFVEQKPVPKFEVGDVMRTLQEATDNITSGLPVVVSIDDEYYRCNNELIAIKDQDDYEYPPMNRIQKPAWSEEEQQNIDSIIAALTYCNENGVSDCFVDPDVLIVWLKSLRPQKQWKPSREQIMALRWVLNHIPYDSHKEEISGLLEQLNKLREE